MTISIYLISSLISRYQYFYSNENNNNGFPHKTLSDGYYNGIEGEVFIKVYKMILTMNNIHSG
jgi:hypothetical protein